MSLSQIALQYLPLPALVFVVTSTINAFVNPEITVLERPEKPHAIVIKEVTIRADGTGVYDRVVLADNVEMVWAGVIFNSRDNVHCAGTGVHRYRQSAPTRRTSPRGGGLPEEFVDWLVGDNCLEGLQAGFTFHFTWTPVKIEAWQGYKYPPFKRGVVEAPLT